MLTAPSRGDETRRAVCEPLAATPDDGLPGNAGVSLPEDAEIPEPRLDVLSEDSVFVTAGGVIEFKSFRVIDFRTEFELSPAQRLQ